MIDGPGRASAAPGRAATSPPIRAYRPDIDGLRAVAVVAVALFHYGVPHVSGGFVGVDVFFVISGCLITAITRDELARGTFSFLAFYERRVRRIVPAYAVMLVIVGLASLLVFLPEDLRLLGKSIETGAGLSTNLLFARVANDYFDVDNLTLEPLLHSWSLAVEAQFYLLYPLLLRPFGASARATAAAIALVGVASFAWAAWDVGHAPAAAFYLLPSRGWELLLGGGVALATGGAAGARIEALWSRGGLARVADATVILGLGAILVPILRYDAATPFPGPAAAVPCLGAALVIAGGSLPGARVATWLGAPPLATLGRYAYSLYLWHWPVVVFARYRFGPHLAAREWLLVLGATAALTVASFALVERPTLRRRVLPSRRGVMGAAAVAAVILLVLGQVLDRTGRGELPLVRLPPEVLALANGHFDRLEGECPVPRDAAVARYPCRFGDEDAVPSVVLWGNSYARMWVPALDREAKQHGAAGLALVFSKCPPLAGLATPALPDCRAFNDEALRFIASHPSLRRVVLGADWFAAGDDLRMLDGTLAALQAIGIVVDLVLAPPQADYPVPRTLAMAALRHDPPPPPIDAATARAAQRASTDIIAGLRARYAFTVIDPATRLCDGAVCPVVRDGHPVFYDAGHVTVSAAETAAGLFDDVFAPEAPH